MNQVIPSISYTVITNYAESSTIKQKIWQVLASSATNYMTEGMSFPDSWNYVDTMTSLKQT